MVSRSEDWKLSVGKKWKRDTVAVHHPQPLGSPRPGCRPGGRSECTRLCKKCSSLGESLKALGHTHQTKPKVREALLRPQPDGAACACGWRRTTVRP